MPDSRTRSSACLARPVPNWGRGSPRNYISSNRVQRFRTSAARSKCLTFAMSATEIIDQIKALEPQKQAKVLALLLEIEAAQKIACMDDERFDDAADRVLSRPRHSRR